MHRPRNGCYQRPCHMYDGGFQVAGFHPECMCSTKMVRATIHALVPEALCHVKQPVEEVEGRGESLVRNDEITQTQIVADDRMECCPCKDTQSSRNAVEDGMNNIYENKNYDEGTSTGSLQMRVRPMCDCSKVNCPQRKNRNGAAEVDQRTESRPAMNSEHQQSTSQVYDERRSVFPTQRICYSVCRTEPLNSSHIEIHQQYALRKRSRGSPPSMRDVGLNHDPEEYAFDRRRQSFSLASSSRMQDMQTNTSAIYRRTCCQNAKCGCYEAAMQIVAGYENPPPQPKNGRKSKRKSNKLSDVPSIDDEEDDFYYDYDVDPYKDYSRQVSIGKAPPPPPISSPSRRQVYPDEVEPMPDEDDWWLENEMKKKQKKENKKRKKKKGGCVIL